MKSREELLRGAVGKLRPESSLREKVLSGPQRRVYRRPAVRRLSLVGAACLAVLAVMILLPSLLDLSVEPTGGAGESVQDTPSLSIEGGESKSDGAEGLDGQEETVQSILIGVMNDGSYLDAVAVTVIDPLSERVSCLFVSSSCAVDVENEGAVPIGELYRIGGVELFETKVEELLDIAVDGAVVLSYDALASFVDAEGGTSVFLLDNEAAYLNECNATLRGLSTEYTAGACQLDGQEAMWLLLFTADGENQLTSRSGRRVALAESLWAESNLAETPAHVEELLAGALDTTLPELPDEKTIASHLLYQFDCIAVPDDPMSVETDYDAEGRELTLYDLSELRERVKDFLISEEMEDMLSSTYLPPYDGGELSPQDQAVAEAFLAICERDTDGLSVSIPAVSLVSWDGPDENGMISASAACLCRRFRLEGMILDAEDSDQLMAASFRFQEQEDGSYRRLSTDGLLLNSSEDFEDFGAYLELTGGDEETAIQIYDILVGSNGVMLYDAIDAALASYRTENGLEDRITGCEMSVYASMMTPVSPPFVDTLTVPEGTELTVESPEGWSFVPEHPQLLLQYLQQETYSYLGRYQFFDEPYGYCFVLISPDGSEEHRLMVTESGFLLVDGVYVYEMPRFVEDGDFGSILNEEYERAQESGTLNTGFQP